VNKLKKIGILTFPGEKEEVTPLLNIVKIISQLSKNLHIITGNVKIKSFKDYEINVHKIKNNFQGNYIKRVLNYIFVQLSISYNLFKIKEVDIWIFFIGGETLFLPMLTAKLMGKKVFLLLPGSVTETLESSGDKFYKVAKILSKINCRLSDKIIIYSSIFINQWSLENFKDKIVIGHEHFLNFEEFKIKKDFYKRPPLIGFIGRLSEEKGILNFIKAIPKTIENDKYLRFLIVGDGYLKDKVKQYLKENRLESKVKLLNGIPHNEVPDYLNELKILVIPSYTEGLPNIMIEAMACGTPVLASKIGAIPDIIKEGNTGFILDENSPKSIENNIIRVLKHDKIQVISKNGHSLIQKEFKFKNTLEKWDEIIHYK
jgi:glycosyltransferase involved in cell wall biosynthesis